MGARGPYPAQADQTRQFPGRVVDLYDQSYTCQPGDRVVVMRTQTAAQVITLPPAQSCPPSAVGPYILYVVDVAGAISDTVTLTVKSGVLDGNIQALGAIQQGLLGSFLGGIAMAGPNEVMAFASDGGSFWFPWPNLSLSAKTWSNKRIKPRIVAAANASSFTPNCDTTDVYNMGTVATPINQAFTLNAPTGTPYDGQKLVMRARTDGTSRAVTYNAIYKGQSGVTLQTPLTTAKWARWEWEYDLQRTQWVLINQSVEA